MSHLDIQQEKEIMDNNSELSIFYSEQERIDMAIQMNVGNLWLYSDVMWHETSAQIILGK